VPIDGETYGRDEPDPGEVRTGNPGRPQSDFEGADPEADDPDESQPAEQ
jgi:hypothetical protein